MLRFTQLQNLGLQKGRITFKRYFNFNLSLKIDEIEAIFVTFYLRKFTACHLLYSARTYMCTGVP